MKRKWQIITSVCLISALLCACTSNTQNKPQYPADGGKEPVYQGNLDAISPLAYGNVDGLELEPGSYISIIGREKSSAYWKAVQKGITQAANDINESLGYTGDDKIKVTFNAPSGVENIDEQVNILDEELSRYPDAIAISSIDADACNVQFDLATENDIPIVAFDSGNSYQGILCTCKTDNEEAANLGASKLCEAIGDTGQVILMVHDSKSTSASERRSGFVKEIESNHPDVQIVETLYYDQMDRYKKEIAEEKTAALPQGEREISADSITEEDVMEYYLEKHPDADGYFGTNITATQTLLQACKDREITEDVTVMGFDAGASQISALKSGDISGLVVQNPFGIGYATVVAAARTILEQGNEAVVDTGYIWVTQENLDQESIANMLYE